MSDLYKAKKEAYESKWETKISRYKERAGKAAEESQATFDSAHGLVKDIPPGQPILIGHHSEKGHRRTLAKHDSKMRKGFELEKKAGYYADKAEAAENNSAISSDDPDAIPKLEAKIAKLNAENEFCKKCNREWRKKKAEEAKGNKYTMQLTDAEREKLLEDLKNYPVYQVK